MGDETCSSCSIDCGVCTGPPVITIHSPINKIYEGIKIGLDVSSDQEIVVWMYALNSGEYLTFNPNITLTAKEGSNSITVVGINQAYQTGTSTVSFSVEISDSDDSDDSSSGGSSSGGGGSSSSGGSTFDDSTDQLSDTSSETTNTEETLNNENPRNLITGGVIGALGGPGFFFLFVLLILVVAGIVLFVIKRKQGGYKMKQTENRT